MTSRPAPRIALLLPVAVFVHQLEEWFGGFVAWVDGVVGFSLTAEQFLVVNAIGLLLFIGGTLAAVSSPHAAWVAASIATLLGVNGVAHVVASLVFGSYSPGAVTGLLLFLPLGVAVLRSLRQRLSGAVYVGAILGGALLHGLATFVALS